MNWLKTTFGAIGIAILGALALFAAAMAKGQRDKARKWQEKAVDIESGKVTDSTLTAEAASTQAKLADAKADAVAARAEERMNKVGEKNEEVATILDRWRKS